MKKISTITFHASYNFGSNLQAYGLQEYIKKIFKNKCDYKIINLRTDRQKEIYSTQNRNSFRNIKKRFIFWGYKNEIKKKEQLFEKFISEKLNLTKEYSTSEELIKASIKSDYFISGSDQLWNVHAFDFEWANLLEFVKKGKKISYAASFGPLKQNWTDEQKKRLEKDLNDFDYISVREEGSYKNVFELTSKNSEIHIDPTMLLTKKEWEKLFDSNSLVNKKYILFYELHGREENIELAKKISKELNLPILVPNCHRKLHCVKEFEKKYDVGPIEFLNLIYNAELVLSSSFHGTVFSILLQKPFFAINGLKDFRINTLLNRMNLEDRSVNVEDFKDKCKKAFDIDFKESEIILDKERKRSEEYLKKALDLV